MNFDPIKMHKYLFLILLQLSLSLYSQKMSCDNSDIEEAYNLAQNTVNINIRRGVLAAGGDYGGEWARDISINTWNGVSLINPEVSERSLWSVTIKKDTIGHQYWDRIIWVITALNHYNVTGDFEFLNQSYKCSVNSIKQLENQAFDSKYGLFTGPSVFNDGIAGYPVPIFDSTNNSSYVLNHKNSHQIKCLSTNCVYYGAYKALAEMAGVLKVDSEQINDFKNKANKLKTNILKNLYSESEGKLYYLIDNLGNVDKSQEGLGISYAIIFGILNEKQALQLTQKANVSKYGITSIYPDFPRYSAQKPGRHNNLIWPMVNGFYAQASIVAGNKESYVKELNGLTHLALDKDKGNFQFWEIYNPFTGIPDGGWQSGHTWKSCRYQTWSATAYINMILFGLVGLRFQDDGILFSPYLPENVKTLNFAGIKYRQSELNITINGKGSKIKVFTLNGKSQSEYKISNKINGKNNILIELE